MIDKKILIVLGISPRKSFIYKEVKLVSKLNSVVELPERVNEMKMF